MGALAGDIRRLASYLTGFELKTQLMKTICLGPITYQLAPANQTIVMQPFHCGMSEPFSHFEAKGTTLARQVSCEKADFVAKAELVWQVYKKIAVRLTEMLNNYHNENLSQRYWEILFWRSVYPFVCSAVDKHDRLETALRDLEVAQVYLPVEPLAHLSIVQRQQYGSNHSLHLAVYAILMPLFPKLKINHISRSDYHKLIQKFGDHRLPANVQNLDRLTLAGIYAKSIMREIRFRIKRSLPANKIPKTAKHYIFMGQQYLSNEDMTGLLQQLGEKPFSYRFPPQKIARDPELNPRRGIGLNVSDTDSALEKTILRGLIAFLPSSLLEDYQQHKNNAKGLIGNSPFVILDSMENVGRQEADFFVAESVERNGSTYVLPCHGGCYGAMEISLSERVWARISDYHCLWSNQNLEYGAHSVKMPALRLHSALKQPALPAATGGIIYFFGGFYPHTYQFESISPYFTPHYPQELHNRFFENLQKHIAHASKVRDYHRALDAMTCQRREIEALGVKIAPKKQSFSQALSQSRLAIHTTALTTYLETLNMNYPTICLWQPGVNLIRQELMTFYNELERVGIIFRDAKAAAHQVNLIYDDVEGWWMDAERQRVVKRFINNVCYTSDDAIDQWAAFLGGLRSQL